MPAPLEIDYLTEGISDGAIAVKLIETAGFAPGRNYLAGSKRRGKSAFDARIRGLNEGVAYGSPVLALRDWDGDTQCVGGLVQSIVGIRHPRLVLRIAVYSVESWLMAHRAAYACYFGVRLSDLPAYPELTERPKDILEGWVRNGHGTYFSRFVSGRRRAGVPDWQIIAEFQTAFVVDAWSVTEAMLTGTAPSLNRAFAALQKLGSLPESIS